MGTIVDESGESLFDELMETILDEAGYISIWGMVRSGVITEDVTTGVILPDASNT